MGWEKNRLRVHKTLATGALSRPEAEWKALTDSGGDTGMQDVVHLPGQAELHPPGQAETHMQHSLNSAQLQLSSPGATPPGARHQLLFYTKFLTPGLSPPNHSLTCWHASPGL